ncbi:hypothetical protein OHV13_34485 [Kitasatospora purpeofusca]|uniref:hypothetical protein n=1 Tax=Kitasatospora purpeofusca TaxID=67352 RepID=UPI00324C96B3
MAELLRALEAGSPLTHHAAGLGSTVLALTRAHQAVLSYADTKQPHFKLVKLLVHSSILDVQAARDAYRMTTAGTTAIANAEAALASAHSIIGPNTDAGDARSAAAAIERQIAPATAAVGELVDLLWMGSPVPEPAATQASTEIAVLTALHNRDGLRLHTDLLGALRRGAMTAAALKDLLWPAVIAFRVVFSVHGARTLRHLDQLLPGARQWPISKGLLAGLPSSREMRTMVSAAQSVKGTGVFVLVPVSACDSESAARMARRYLNETLDQYVAGQRLLRLALGDRSVVFTPKAAIGSDIRTGGAKQARPLTMSWSTSLRPALRMANLATSLDAPLASTALCWSALNSIGVETVDHRRQVARAVALHSVRQQVVFLFKTIANEATALLEHADWLVDQRAAKLKVTERALGRTEQSPSPRARGAATRLAVEATQQRSDIEAAHVLRDALHRRLQAAVQTVQQTLLGGSVPGHPRQLSSWQLDLNDFLDALLPLTESTPEGVRANHHAIRVLAQHEDGLARAHLESWATRLGSPEALKKWIERQEQIYLALLTWMYAMRNMAIHSGTFTAVADELTAHAARTLVDMVLEIIGNWHAGEHAAGNPERDALEVVGELADRQQDLIGALGAATSCRPLNVATITGPGSDAWHRP